MFCRHTHNYQCSVFQLMLWRMIRIKGVKIVWTSKNAWGVQFVSIGAKTPPPSLIVRSSCLHWSNHQIMAMPQKRFPPRKRNIHIPCKVSMGSGAICCLLLASDSSLYYWWPIPQQGGATATSNIQTMMHFQFGQKYFIRRVYGHFLSCSNIVLKMIGSECQNGINIFDNERVHPIFNLYQNSFKLRSTTSDIKNRWMYAGQKSS